MTPVITESEILLSWRGPTRMIQSHSQPCTGHPQVSHQPAWDIPRSHTICREHRAPLLQAEPALGAGAAGQGQREPGQGTWAAGSLLRRAHKGGAVGPGGAGSWVWVAPPESCPVRAAAEPRSPWRSPSSLSPAGGPPPAGEGSGPGAGGGWRGAEPRGQGAPSAARTGRARPGPR